MISRNRNNLTEFSSDKTCITAGIEKCGGECSENHGLEGMGKSHRHLTIPIDDDKRKEAVLIANATLDTPSSDDSEQDGKELKKKTSVIRFQDEVEKEENSSATPDLKESDDENC